jgi:hypothetical protein
MMKVIFLGHARAILREQIYGDAAIVEVERMPEVGDRFIGRECLYRVAEVIRPMPDGAAPHDNPDYEWDALIFMQSHQIDSGDGDRPINLQR